VKVNFLPVPLACFCSVCLQQLRFGFVKYLLVLTDNVRVCMYMYVCSYRANALFVPN